MNSNQLTLVPILKPQIKESLVKVVTLQRCRFLQQTNKNDVIYYIIYYLLVFNMPIILAGTAYNQMILFDPNDKRKKKETFGTLSRHPVLHLSYCHPRDFGVYASAKTLTSVFQGETSEIVKLSGKESIVSA